MANAQVSHPEDLELAQKLMAGDAGAAETLTGQIRPVVEGRLMQQCSDEGSREKSREIVADVIGECFSRKHLTRDKRSLLELYQGRTSLTGWLILVASSRLKTWWRRERIMDPLPSDGNASLGDGPAGEGGNDGGFEPEIVEILRIALENAFSKVPPEDLVFMRLVFLHGIKRETIAQIWNCHPATIGRDITSAASTVQRETLRYVQRLDPYLTLLWTDCVAICEQYPRLLAGDRLEKLS
ncbi:MAG: sigma-70 family RNA polymerase sigma factor [Verrucomicrobia bacterium]|nr:sigma-70 family RNA polymerase sigma factor [Verrucomicrobiota bacterium]